MSKKVVVGYGSCGIAAGAKEIHDILDDELKKLNNGFKLDITSCMGMCYREPMVEIIDDDKSYVYGDVNKRVVKQLIDKHIKGGEIFKDKLVISSDVKTDDETFLSQQTRLVLKNCGKINPERIGDYLAQGGYESTKRVLTSMKPEEIRELVLKSNLRGRGGAGFPTGMKWNFAAANEAEPKYFICNADEGDPGAFMDRSVLEGDPHAVLEGMIIGSFAIGAAHGYIYCRAEYPLAIKRLNIAIEQAKEKGFLGKNILGSGHDFDITIKEGAGAFVCGEETALIASIEGYRGMPKMRPPFPANSGLWEAPTIINNVETLASVSKVIQMGPEEYAKMGHERSGGTKVFAVTGKVKRSGLVEVPMGITLKKLIFDIAGGILDDKEFKAVQLGGPTGGCLPYDLLDTPVDYESLMQTGAVVGSGGLVVADHSTCMVDMARFFLGFAQNESCGKCTPCRIGTKRMLEILNAISEGRGVEEHLDELKDIGAKVKQASLCALGGTAPNPVLTTIRYFEDEYIAHIKDKKCPAGVCRELITIMIDDSCTGCEICKKECPQDAISGERKKLHKIDEEKCIQCKICLGSCPFDSIYAE